MLQSAWTPARHCLVLTVYFSVIAFVNAVTLSCEHLKHSPYASADLLMSKQNEILSVCPSLSTSCCTSAMEQKIKANDAKAFRMAVEDRIIVLRQILHSGHDRLRTIFLGGLSSCYKHLDTMFDKTYGKYYQQNRDVFASFFDQLRAFASPHSVMPVDFIIDNFFENLYKKLFELLNPMRPLEDSTWRCMRNSIEETRPFADIPQRIKEGLRRGLDAWRVVLKSTHEAHNSLNAFLNVTLSSACSVNLARMGDCALCSQHEPTKPCYNFCLNVGRGCLAEWAEVDQPWDNYVDSMGRLFTALNGPHSLQAAFNPLPVQLSEAIMTFQDRGTSITNKAIANCFPLGDVVVPSDHLIRRPRAVWLRHVMEQADGNWRSLNAALVHFGEKLQVTKGTFKQLPEDVCAEHEFSMQSDDFCWNGVSIGSYQKSEAGIAILAQKSNPEFQGSRLFEYQGQFIDERIRLIGLSIQARDAASSLLGALSAIEPVDQESDENELDEASGVELIEEKQANEKSITTNALEHTSSSSTHQVLALLTVVVLIL